MCLGCGDAYFEPPGPARPPVTGEMARLAESIAQADRNCGISYGGLHIVIADWNLSGDHIGWCLGRDGTPGVTEAERSIGVRLLALGEPERYLVMEIAERRGYDLAREARA